MPSESELFASTTGSRGKLGIVGQVIGDLMACLSGMVHVVFRNYDRVSIYRKRCKSN